MRRGLMRDDEKTSVSGDLAAARQRQWEAARTEGTRGRAERLSPAASRMGQHMGGAGEGWSELMGTLKNMPDPGVQEVGTLNGATYYTEPGEDSNPFTNDSLSRVREQLLNMSPEAFERELEILRMMRTSRPGAVTR